VARYTCGCLGNYVLKGFLGGTFGIFARLGGPSLQPLRDRTFHAFGASAQKVFSMPSALRRGGTFRCLRRFCAEGLFYALGASARRDFVAKMVSHAIFQYNVLVIDIDNTTLGLI